MNAEAVKKSIDRTIALIIKALLISGTVWIPSR